MPVKRRCSVSLREPGLLMFGSAAAGEAAAEYHHVRCQGLLLGLVPRPHRRRLVSILTGHTNSILRSTSVGNADQQGWD